ncbi:protein kinase domain-containing protein, partial [Actinomadura rubrisoli]
MGLVYLARSPGGRLVAVKVIHTHLTDDPLFRARFRREAEAAKAVSGFYTAPVVDADPYSRPAWLATAHVAGPDLNDVVVTHGALPRAMVTALAAALSEALKAIHEAGLVHRDLKPSNILLAQDGPRVIDFGIVHAADGTETIGGLVGTPGYMSPEQAEGREVQPASDVFSLGGVLYFAVTGRPPFGAGDLREVLCRVAQEEPDLAPVPAALRDLIARCLAKRPSERPTPDRLLEELADSVTADPADWAAGPHTPMIDEYVTEMSLYSPAPAPPRPVPEPEAVSEPDAVPQSDVVPRSDAVLVPEPAPARAPEPRRVVTRRAPLSWPPQPSGERRPRRPPRWTGWAVPAAIGLVITLVVVLDGGNAGTGAGFQPWSVDNVNGRAVILDGLLYIGKSDGAAAYDPRTGKRRWKSKSGEAEVAIGRYSAVLLTRSDTHLSALDPMSGSRRWRIPLSVDGCVGPSGPTGHVVVIDGTGPPGGGEVRLSLVDAVTGTRLADRTLKAGHCGSGADINGDRVSVIASGKTGQEDDTLVSMAAGSSASWRATQGDARLVTSDDEHVYTVIGKGADGLRIRAYASGTGRLRWDIPFRVSDDDGDFSAAYSSWAMALPVRSRLYVLSEDGLDAFDTTNGRRRWESSFNVGADANFFVLGDMAYVWWDATKLGFLHYIERTAMAAVDLTNGRRLWRKTTNSGADIAWADDRAAYVASFRKRRFRSDENALISLDARTGTQRWRRGMDADDLIVGSGIVYVRDGDTLEAVNASTGEGP